MMNVKNSHLRFRPLIGVSFCKRERTEIFKTCIKSSFRPLIGVSFCKRCITGVG